MVIELGFLITTLTFWVEMQNKQNWSHFNKYKAVKSSYKSNTCYMISNVAKSFLVLMLFNNIAIAFDVTLSSFSVLALFLNFRDFLVFAFGWFAERENPVFKERFCFLVYKAQMHMDLFLITISTFYVLKLK